MRPKNDKKSANRPSRGQNSHTNGEMRPQNRRRDHRDNRDHHAPSQGERTDRGPSHKGAHRPPRQDGLRAPNNSYFLWGHHALEAALSNQGRRIKALYCTNEGRDRLMGLLSSLPQSRIADLPNPKSVERHQLDNMPDERDMGGKIVHQGMAAAVSPLDNPHLDDFLESLHDDSAHRLMVLDQVSDPRNIGAILRSARAFGTSALIMQDRNAPEETGALARTAVGALEEITIIRVVNLARALDTLKDYHFHIAGLDMDGTTDTNRAASSERLALVMGSEGKGMRRLTSEACDEILSIQMADSSESLNVSVAAAIIMHSTQPKDQ